MICYGPRVYEDDVLAGNWRRPGKGKIPQVPAELDLVVEDADSGFCGAVVACDKEAVTLEDRFGKRRLFPLAPAAFLLEGKVVTLVRPAATTAAEPRRTASGSIAVEGLRARVAKESRIYVEGVHDAALVEKIWGHDLRVEGVVVEYLEGVDDLPAIVAEFGPSPERRLGVLVDHLVPGSKESRIAAQVTSPHVLVVGHPYVDIWQAVKPARLGLAAWPDVPRTLDWKHGACAALGLPAADQADVAAAWKMILDRVRSWNDLERPLLTVVEQLIDFVTEDQP